MRIAIVHADPVSSRAVGGTTRIYALVCHLAPRHEVHVFTHLRGPKAEADAAADELAALGVTQHVMPQPPASWFTKARWATQKPPYFVSHNRNPVIAAAIAALDRERGIDVVHIELNTLAPLLGGLGPGCARVLAEQELMSLSVERLRTVPARHKNVYQRYITHQLPRIRSYESEVLRRFDRLFGITAGEAARMAELSGREVGVLPHVVDTRRFTPLATSKSSQTILFVANYAHHPNVEAVFWLMEHVWPLVHRDAPRARVRLVGPDLEAGQIRSLTAMGAEVSGRVEDVARAYSESVVFANAIRSGGGMRGKVLEAFACGIPVVSTTIGLEGIAAIPGEHCDRSDDERGFAAAIVRLLNDEAQRRERAERARALVATHYDVGVVLGRLEATFEEACAVRRARTGVRA